MGSSLTLFRIFNIDVRVHWSFILILGYGAFIFSSGPAGPIAGALYGILVILLLFVCVTLHEFGHALVAQYYKIEVTNITLLPIGGVANLARMPDKPRQEFIIALAGPLVNIALALLLVPLALVAVSLEVRAGMLPVNPMQILANMQTPGVGNLLVYLIGTNILLALFNLLPAFPMDGGRILRAVLAMGMPRVRATRAAVTVGRIMAVLFAIWGIFGGGIFLLLIAFFVYVGGGAELEAVESRAVLKHIKARAALPRNATSLYASEQISRAVDLIMNSYQTDYPVKDLSGKFIGVMTRQRLVQGLKTSGPDGRVVDCMIKAEDVPVCPPDMTLAEVWEKMVGEGSRVVAIKEDANFLGLLNIDDITEVFQVMGAAQEGTRATQPESTPSQERAADV
ncbi:MAG: site-2 protease family protein [Litorilinea sp.]